MQWPALNTIQSLVDLPEGYSWDFLGADEINAAIEFFKTWFPSIAVGMGSVFLDERFYRDNVSKHGELDMPILAVVVRHGEQIVGIATWEKISGADVIYGRVGAVAKHHRKSSIATIGMVLGERIGQLMGAGLIYGMATTTTPYMQQALEHAGYSVAGIMPGYDREEVEPGLVRRVYEVIYVKKLSDDAEFITPSVHNLTPRVAEVYAAMFGALIN